MEAWAFYAVRGEEAEGRLATGLAVRGLSGLFVDGLLVSRGEH